MYVFSLRDSLSQSNILLVDSVTSLYYYYEFIMQTITYIYLQSNVLIQPPPVSAHLPHVTTFHSHQAKSLFILTPNLLQQGSPMPSIQQL